MLTVSGCLAIGFAVWHLLTHGRVLPVFWVIGAVSLLGLIPVNRLPKWLRDLGSKVQIIAGLGVFAVGLALDLAPLLDGVIVPRQAYQLIFWFAIFGIGLMIVGLLTAGIGINDWGERYLASHPDARDRIEAIQRQRRHH